jgi:hypothetical protein
MKNGSNKGLCLASRLSQAGLHTWWAGTPQIPGLILGGTRPPDHPVEGSPPPESPVGVWGAAAPRLGGLGGGSPQLWRLVWDKRDIQSRRSLGRHLTRADSVAGYTWVSGIHGLSVRIKLGCARRGF